MNIHLYALGCRLNEAELQTWGRDFESGGHQIVREPENAELIVVNTCAVTEEAAKKSRKLVRKLHRSNPQAKLAVTGCYASLSPAQAAEMMGVDLVVSNQDKDKLVALVQEQLIPQSLSAAATAPGEHAMFARGRDRAFVKIQDGCRYRCTFCIVTVARGQERSRSIADIVQEVNALHANGILEVVITGVHVGGYGSDTGSNLGELIQAVLDDTNIPRIRMASVEPWDLEESFLRLFENPRLMPHMHLPMQSGSDSVLKRMARRCKTEEFFQLMNRLREIPHFNVTTDIIVGFPGETEAEWQETLAFVEAINFGHIHIFAYSPREGTKAATLADPVARDVKRIRSQQLHELAEHSKLKQLHVTVGETMDVLFESALETDADGVSWRFGYTPNYKRVAVPVRGESPKARSIHAVVVESVHTAGDFLVGSLEG